MNGLFDTDGSRFAADCIAAADRIRHWKPSIATEFDALAIQSLRDDCRFKQELEWQDSQFSAFAPIVADLLAAGKLDPIPATAFLNRHAQGAAHARQATA